MKMIKLKNKRINRMLNFLKLVKIIFYNEKFKIFVFLIEIVLNVMIIKL
jgi:hypothetical protein